jgi:hypothetical protein
MAVKHALLFRTVIGVALGLGAGAAAGCGRTACDRLARDRQEFLDRATKDSGVHLEVTVPYAVANGLIEPTLSQIAPLPLEIPGLGQLASSFGEITVRPRRVALRPAHGDLVGVRLDFDVRAGGDQAFGLWVETEIEPEVELAAGRVRLGFATEKLQKVKPHLTDDAAAKLGGMIHKRIPSLLRGLVPRAEVDKVAARVVEHLLERFYAVSKDELLPRLSEMSRLTVALPDVPIRDLDLAPTDEAGGGLRLSIATALPVSAGLGPRAAAAPLPADRVSVRASAPAVAELVNWAMGRGLVPSRYNAKGKPDEKGELVIALEWIPGERPMKAHLWQLEGSCKRVDLGANVEVDASGGELRIRATDGVIEDVESAPFMELGVLLYALFKDAVSVTMSRSAELEFSVAGNPLVSRVERAAFAGDELEMTVALAATAATQRPTPR